MLQSGDVVYLATVGRTSSCVRKGGTFSNSGLYTQNNRLAF